MHFIELEVKRCLAKILVDIIKNPNKEFSKVEKGYLSDFYLEAFILLEQFNILLNETKENNNNDLIENIKIVVERLNNDW